MYTHEVWAWAVCFAAAYLLGSVSGGIIVSRRVFKTDIRSHGSGNAGLTNALRAFGKKSAVFVSAIDIAKTAAALWLGRWLIGDMAIIVAGAGVVIGHAFPVYYRFKGGKCVLSSAIIVLFIDWRAFALVMTVFGLVTFATRMVSVGSLSACVSAIALTALFERERPEYAAFIAVLTAFIAVLHRANIKRILSGTEHKLGKKRG